MVPSSADQQGEKFPHSFLSGCTHGSLFCWSTEGKIPPFLSPWLLSWFPLLLINNGQIFPHSFLPGCSHVSLSCWSTMGKYSPIPFSLAALMFPSPADQQWANIPPFLSPWLLSCFPLLLINNGQIFPHSFLPCCSNDSLSCWLTGVTIALISYSLSWIPLLQINKSKYSLIPLSLDAHMVNRGNYSPVHVTLSAHILSPSIKRGLKLCLLQCSVYMRKYFLIFLTPGCSLCTFCWSTRGNIPS
jgi:hypothetical protein